MFIHTWKCIYAFVIFLAESQCILVHQYHHDVGRVKGGPISCQNVIYRYYSTVMCCYLSGHTWWFTLCQVPFERLQRPGQWSLHLFVKWWPHINGLPIGSGVAQCSCRGEALQGETYRHYNDVLMNAIASQITSLTIVYSTVCLGVDQRKYQSSPSLVFLMGFHRWPVNSPHKGPVTRKMFSFDDVIMHAIFESIHYTRCFP